MKTSNKLFSAAILILLAAMIVYDFQLKAEYVTMKRLGLGQYQKDHRFDNYEKADVKKFSSIDLRSANVVRITIEYGEKEAVWVDKGGKDMVNVSQNGETLMVDLSDKGKEDIDFYKGSVIIISPKIKSIHTTAHTYSRKKNQNTRVSTRFQGGPVSITGFRQDSLQLIVAGWTNIDFNKNELKHLNAIVGGETGNGELSISSNNNVESMKLKVEGESTVEVLDSDVKKIDHQIAEGAIVTFRGVVIHQLTKND